MKTINLISMLAFSLMLVACADKYDPNKEYGFIMQDGEQGLQNPPPNKTRLYGFRDGIYGFLVRYNATLHTLQQANDDFKDGFFFGRSKPNSAFFIDIVPSGEPIFISGKTEARTNFSWIPKPDRIYCVNMGLRMGFLIGRPYFTLIDKEKCLKIVPKLLEKDFMQEWLKDKQDYENNLADKKTSERENQTSDEF